MVETKIRIPGQKLRKCKVAIASNPGRDGQCVVGRANIVSQADDSDRARKRGTQRGVCQRGTEEVPVEVVKARGGDPIDDGGLGAGKARSAVNHDVLRTRRRDWCFGGVQNGPAGENCQLWVVYSNGEKRKQEGELSNDI